MPGANRCFAHGSNAEAAFKRRAESKGWTVLRAGWPDYLITDGGKPRFVEVKSETDTLSEGQVELFEGLEKAGIRVVIWWEAMPDKLLPWRRFSKLSAPARRRPERRFPTVRSITK
jgi:hypothetical protein